MTQEVQPLTWQKRTNLEEHQQFFSKINEIVANLAPTVDEAEAAIAQATQAIASANAAIATANAASASADAASQQAQAAATTVAGYDTRLTAAESKNTQQDTAISALQTADGQDVKLSGNQNITGIKTVPTETTGSRSQQIANSVKIGAELDSYASMLRTTGNQTKVGVLTLKSPLVVGDNVDPGANILLYGKSGNRRIIFQNIEEDITKTPPETINQNMISWCDKNDQPLVNLTVFRNTNGSTNLMAFMRKSDGTYGWKTIMSSE